MELEPNDDVFLQENLGPSIAEHAMQCSNLFRKYMAMPGILPDPTVMDDQSARFTLWTSNMDVFGSPNVSLDYRLRFSPTVVEIIHQLLDVICDSLTSLKPIDDPPQSPSRKKQRISKKGDIGLMEKFGDCDENDNEDQAQENVSLITYNIGGTVTRLFRLSSAIRKSAKDRRTHKIRKYNDDEETNRAIDELRLYTDCYIRFRYPQAPEVLRLALVNANALRLRRLCYQRSHRRRTNLSIQLPQENTKSFQLPDVMSRALDVRFAPVIQPKRGNSEEHAKSPGPPPAPITYATTARQTDVKALYANSTVEVPRAKSVLVNNKLSFPPVPTTSECPYCGVILELKGSAKSVIWNDHVVRDLEPFVCMFAQCTESDKQEPGSLTFETSRAWVSHMQNAHSYAWECRAPSHDPMVFDNEVRYQEHACKEHGVPRAHVNTLSNAARRPNSQKIRECPFGDDYQSPKELDSSSVFSSEALHLHIAGHMKEIALLALQKLPSDSGNIAENIDSDQPLEDDGLRFAKLRGSMYSVLDDENLDFQDEVEANIVTRDEDGVTSSVGRLDLEDKDEHGRSKLHHAILEGNRINVQSYIDQGADLYARADDGKTALHYASLISPSNILEILLRSVKKDAVNLKDVYGQTPLHCAAKRAFVDKISLLMEYGAARDITDNYGLSPYLWAVLSRSISGTESAVRLFLDQGVDVNSTSADGRSALAWAVGLSYSSIVDILLTNGADAMPTTVNKNMMPLEEAAANGSHGIVETLLKYGVDPDYRDLDGWSAIHWAAEGSQSYTVQLLSRNGANINAVSSYGTSPLHCAANGGSSSTVNLLLENGADPSKSTCHGWTALHHAAYMGHSRVVQSLLRDDRMKTMASNQDNHGWSALHLAVFARDLDTVRALLDCTTVSVSRFQCDENGLAAEDWLDFVPLSHPYTSTSALAFSKSRCCRAITGLRQALMSGHKPLVEHVLGRGDKVNSTDSGRRSALYCAVKKGRIDIIDMLLENLADPNLLPIGRKTWEEFVSDEEILSRLRRAGYKQRISDPKIEEQIRLAFKQQDRSLVPGQSTMSSSSQPTVEEAVPFEKLEEPKSRMTKIWKRLRGQ